MKLTTQKQVINSFYDFFPEFIKEQKLKNKTTDCRCCFFEYVDYLCREEVISEKLANLVTI